ncbi:MAG: HAD family hydrolase [Ignavibacteria bacterium]|nr:MAG: HAD family hydrolase [Ignavibacteria bacterium]
MSESVICYHCGDECNDDSIRIDDKYFCCNGCKTVYEILSENDLCDYYQLESNPGIKKDQSIVRNFDFLDDPSFSQNFIEFTSETITSVEFTIPQMHCSSCIWILENLNRLNNNILSSRVDFLKKKLNVKYNSNLKLSELALLLDSLGYTPDLSLEDGKKKKQLDKQLYYQIGIAGFAFGNIMLLSFPEYLSLGSTVEPWLRSWFGYLSLILSIPVLLYSSKPYLVSAYKGLRNKIVNIDVPISIGVLTIFIRSSYEVLTGAGAGFFDSFAGLIFFLLIGKLFQNKTYESLNFERTYKSYFPVSITINKNNAETTIPLEKLRKGDRFIAKNGEIIPTDSVLLSPRAFIDYSFVTGESVPVEKVSGDIIYAGGKQLGGKIELEAIKEVSQSYLTKLWQNTAFRNEESFLDNITNVVSKYFTFVIISIALIAALYWMIEDPSKAVFVFSAVLIVACPCALALSMPFTLGNTMRIFGRNKFYLKNVYAIERMANITNIVFDKTGTITKPGSSKIYFEGELDEKEKLLVKSAVENSYHPLSRDIANSLQSSELMPAENYEEFPGKGILVSINKHEVKIGSANFVLGSAGGNNLFTTEVHVSIDGIYKGKFIFRNKIRPGFDELINKLKGKFQLSLISGDSSVDREELKNHFPSSTLMLFGKSPEDKLDFIKKLQLTGKRVLMVGDGLNDAGALAQSDVGISITDDINNFSPACDGILEGKKFSKFADFIFFAKTSKNIIIISFVISFIYNVVGLYFAVSGQLSPLFAAILMPLSSISVVVFTTTGVNLAAIRKGLK